MNQQQRQLAFGIESALDLSFPRRLPPQKMREHLCPKSGLHFLANFDEEFVLIGSHEVESRVIDRVTVEAQDFFKRHSHSIGVPHVSITSH